jgi:hypothetical protein
VQANGTPAVAILTIADNDCDGAIDSGCPSSAGESLSCYGGPAGTQGIGECRAGTQLCEAGTWGACTDQVLPAAEVCEDGLDNDCDGLSDGNDVEDCPAEPDGAETEIDGGVDGAADEGPDAEGEEGEEGGGGAAGCSCGMSV